MLKGNLFKIKEKRETENGCSYRLVLNASHPIYEAHFAGNPVTPGACIVQMIKELAEKYLNRTLTIASVKNTKFLNVIQPVIHNEITIEMQVKPKEGSSFSLSSVVFDKDIIFAKCTLEI